jgi:hypothetical protein
MTCRCQDMRYLVRLIVPPDCSLLCYDGLMLEFLPVEPTGPWYQLPWMAVLQYSDYLPPFASKYPLQEG